MKKIILVISLMLAASFCMYGCGTQDASSAQSSDSSPRITDSTEIEHPVSSQWFDDAVFLGDSVTLKLSYYCDENPDALGNARFFCAGSLGYTNALWELDREDAVHPYYKGEVQLSENCAVATGANKVFVMLGMNDVGLYGPEGALESAETLITKIKTNSPDAVIYVQSVTPIVEGKERGDLTNENIREFNGMLKSYCSENSLAFLDIYNMIADENGFLPEEYCGDIEAQGIHFTDKACELWVDFLKNNV